MKIDWKNPILGEIGGKIEGLAEERETAFGFSYEEVR